MPRIYTKKPAGEVASEWFSLRITPILKDALNRKASETNRPMGEIAREALEKGLSA